MATTDGEPTSMVVESSAPTPSLSDPTAIVAYIQRVASSLLEEDDSSSSSGGSSLASVLHEHADVVRKFIADPMARSLFVQKISNKDEEREDEYLVTLGAVFTSVRAVGVILIKRGNYIEGDKSFGSQIRLVVLNEGSPYETLHTYISSGVAPFFKSYLQETGRSAESSSDKLAPSVEKKMAELEMGLLHLQQNIDIPEISLALNPIVAATVSQCAMENRRPKVSDFGDRVEDSKFLNDLQHGVNRWVKEIQKVTKLDRDPSSGTTLQEVSFWLNLERALLKLQEKRESIDVELTLEILRHGKRFHATVSFDTDTGLKQALATVNDYSPLMKDFPVHDLLAATDLDKVRTALQYIFGHLRKIRNTKYPIQRALRLVEAISRDLATQLLKILGTRRLMMVPYDEFERVMASCFDIFNTWDEEYEKLQGLLRDILKKKRDEMKLMWRVNFSHKKLHIRMEQIRKFRRQHEQLRSVIERVLRPDQETMVDGNAHEEVSNAYSLLEQVEALEMSKEGQDVWDGAVRRYNERVDTVEAKITAALREQLATAKSANEMFRIFARFNALFVRPQIRGAIREYQTQLIQRVKDDIEALHEKFKTQYSLSKAYRMSELRDIPPVSGSIIWGKRHMKLDLFYKYELREIPVLLNYVLLVYIIKYFVSVFLFTAKQIDRQLTTYLRRVEAILGSGWENHVDGQRLKSDGDSFRLKLNTQPIFDEWVAKVQQKDATVTGRIFDIEQTRGRTGAGKQILRLKVNFLPEIITLSKEVRHLKNLGYRVPLAIMNKAHQANQMYPFAISLMESVRTYERSWEKIEDRANVTLLVAGSRQEVHIMIQEGMALVWESYKLDPYVKKLSEVVFQFAEKVDEVLSVEMQVSVDIKLLESCAYSAKTFGDILAKIQKAVDDLSLKQYSNLTKWVQHIDTEVEKRLVKRLEAGIQAWTSCLEERRVEVEDPDDMEDNKLTHKLGGDPELGELKLEMRMTQQTLWVYPAAEEVRQQLLQKLFAWQAIATSHPRIQSSRYQVGLEKGFAMSYKDLLAKLPSNLGTLASAYEAIEKKMLEVTNYVNEWLCYQSLWDLQPDQLYGKLGEDMNLWLKCLADIKQTRSTFDTAEIKRTFGPVTIEYGKVQSKVSLKYDSWHKDALAKFSALLSSHMIMFHTEVAKSRTDLENQSIETSSTSEAVGLITYVQNLKKKMLEWEEKVGVYKEGQRMLERQRFQLPNNWLHIDSVEGEWSSFSEILKRKDSSIQTQVASLQSKIMSEDKAVEVRTATFLQDWEKEKPVKADFKPMEALRQLLLFETRYTKLKEERGNVARAKEALEMTGIGSETDDRFAISLEELQDLKGVWSELSRVWEQIDQVKETPWLSVQPRKIRGQIDALLTQLKDLPAKLRQYASYEHVKKLIQGYAKVNTLIVELKSEALKERHWKTLMKSLRVNWNLNELTLGQVWDVDLQKNEKTLRDVIIVAQGEMALEEFLKQVRESWQNYELELINYQNKCKLIKGWDDLFNKLKEHINSVAAMKLSPYYKVFEEEATSWEEKLNRILALFDVWIDVQRRWVYLEGIFLSSQDIKALLPMETSRFHSISAEFLGLMKRVSKSPKVLDVLNIQGVQRSLERLADLLGKIQKALGEYLERERSSFPRFYFVGDEDLLEIIGNSKNIARLQKHFKKMFAGVSSVILNEDQSTIMGIASREGEVVIFLNPVIVTDQKVNEWLSAVEREMRLSLATSLAKAVNEVAQFNEKIDPKLFMEWVDRFPAQLINLAAQIWWCDGVEGAIGTKGKVEGVVKRVEATLTVLADSVLHEQPALRRKKLEHLINEFVHKRTVTRHLLTSGVSNNKAFEWLRQMRFYFDPNQPDVLKKLSIHMADAKFNYGFEYLGVQEKLVQTPLTDKCYLTMTQALEARLGGSPFGPAGTGKTESVKALGHQLGRFVLVFNCDETFDFQAMGRIFVGLCQVGAWGCFDEFNRLEERMLSAVSQQIQTIQEALKSQKDGQKEGSDALKSVLVSAGNVKRDRIQRIKETSVQRGETIEESKIAENLPEQEILIQSICETMVPKLVAEDIPLLFSLLSDVFPGINYTPAQMDSLKEQIRAICKEEYLVSGENSWMEKVLQLYQIQSLSHGVMLVGNSGTGKSTAWRVLLRALERLEGVEGVCHVIDPKALSKEALYGFMDPNTREWTDGLFTHILRKIIDNVRGERGKRQWIVFDGDVDPEWVENLNSVLDDNKLLTLPNGERLALPPNVRLLFEVQDLKHATLATVSRCGMVWFSHDVLSTEMLFHNFLSRLENICLDDSEEGEYFGQKSRPAETPQTEGFVTPALKLQRDISSLLQPLFVTDGLVDKCLEFSSSLEHIMDFTRMRALSSLFCMMNEAVRQIHGYNAGHVDFPLESDVVDRFMTKSLVYGMLWSFTGDAKLKTRHELGEFIRSTTTIPLPPGNAQMPIVDYEVTMQGEWSPWAVKVPRTDVETHKVASPDAVVPTVDTVRHESLLATWLAEHKPLVLCGPPGSGKTMTLLSALRALPDMEVVSLNFSSATTPELLLKTFDHYCEYRKTPNGIVLSPVQLGKWLILFCDEINLPDMDKYGTQRVISFLRQLVEHGCFFRTSDHSIVRLERIQFVGACNPPTDPGRKPLSHRFLRHVPVVYVDYPGETSLKQIYGTFNRAMLKLVPSLMTYSEPLTNAMVEFFLKSQERFTQDMQPHYVYSPREMTRWVRGIYEAIRPLDALTVEGLVRLWAHEALRLFQDRLVYDDERAWTNENIDTVALRHFPTIDRNEALQRPILYSNWLSKDYTPVDRESSFLERMNTLLANGEVPGLFEGDEFTTLMTQCKEGAAREGLMLDTVEELYKWFAGQVMRNLHVVFTMNPSEQGLKDRAATSPALFNRCVLDWFGDWTNTALFQVAKELTMKVDLENGAWKLPLEFPIAFDELNPATINHRDAVINGFVFVHLTLHKANRRLAKRGGTTMAITPRHFLDFINHFVKLYNEKRSDLEEQQLHLNIGLNKIAETVEQVEEMKKSLELKKKELKEKDEMANNKLKEMISQQQQAEQRKVQSKTLQANLEVQTKEISKKQEDVTRDLEQVEPAVRDAQQAVSSIKKQQLVEVRSMANPPAVVKLALESICLLLGENAADWKAIRTVLMKENFISTIVNFQTEYITDDVREKMLSRYVSNPEYTYEKVNRASLACGPLVKWAIAQISYSDVLRKVEPLREELRNLESAAYTNQTEARQVQEDIDRLEKQITSYKEDYARLIAQAQAIKSDLENVQSKVERSMSLLRSLGMEKDRWEGSSEGFKTQMNTIVGDTLLSSGFLAYAGYFDQHYRQNLFTAWSEHLGKAAISYRQDMALSEYLSHPDERLRWKGNLLPDDDLCTENAIMLKRFNRYPLIIDPSGQATEFLEREYADRKLTKTSFLDDSFRKNLESALRFGNPLLVQDVESYDPILNPVLNREVRRTGGRVLISLGEQDIDLSPSFVIFLSTRDPTVEFAPDVCSRVTFVNFTVTRASLQSQCLNQVLRAERPDIDQKRSDLLKLQGEFQVRLRHLEKSLLGALNEAKGKILDDDSVITTLENLKHEAAEISKKVEETDIVIQEIDQVSQQYMPMAQACSAIYFMLDNMHQMHFLYQYSLQFFLDMFNSVLNGNPKLGSVKDYSARLDIITKDLFTVCSQRVTRGMLHVDRLPFAILLARIYTKGIFEGGFQSFLRFREGVFPQGKGTPALPFLSQDQAEGLCRLQAKVGAFKNVLKKVDSAEFKDWVRQPTPESNVPTLWDEEKGGENVEEFTQTANRLLIIQAVRPDRVVAMGHILVDEVLGSDFIPPEDVNLSSIVESEVTSRTPVLLCSAPGFDASGRVDDLAAQKSQTLVSIAIGSAEGFTQADGAIASAVKTGRWVLLKNVHLAPQWLLQLEKKLHSLQPHPQFRLFLTMDIHPKIPVNLLRAGRVFVFEPPPGIKANLLRTFNNIPASRMMKAPNERARLYFLVAWFHAVVQERLRYVPLGWAKFYEFNEADLRVACDTLDAWIDSTAMGRTNLPPDKVPWDALKTLLSETIYGGKVDNEFDARLLSSFVHRLFTPRSFEQDFLLVANADGGDISMPDALRRDQFMSWANTLTHRQTPAWLGLPTHAEKVLLTSRGAEMASKLLKMQLIEDDEDLGMSKESVAQVGIDEGHVGAPAWMRTLHVSAEEWLKVLPEKLNTMKRTADNIKRPLYRFYEREITSAAKMLEAVRSDLIAVKMICQGEKKQTSYHRNLISELVRGIIPDSWKGRYSIPRGCTVINWINDLALRIEQFIGISQTVKQKGAEQLESIPVWLGGLIIPEAYFTATRQCVAQANGWSVEELVLDVVIGGKKGQNFVLNGLKLQGAVWKDGGLQLSADVLSDLPDVTLTWVKHDPKVNLQEGKILLPVYLNSTRDDLLFTVDMKMVKQQDKYSFYERGVAILASTLT
ncbi:Dynein heavy chain, cytoplasmic [Folsomia candida]|uniref:Dynein heavy chain, cytoplasmic n=1 Tax=Folsomia candida TaxID=158441 RepID=A0A226E0V2_FOLCA|nr:Dynein heavy chain, cytoplasmic [Folsomia candida]